MNFLIRLLLISFVILFLIIAIPFFGGKQISIFGTDCGDFSIPKFGCFYSQ